MGRQVRVMSHASMRCVPPVLSYFHVSYPPMTGGRAVVGVVVVGFIGHSMQFLVSDLDLSSAFFNCGSVSPQADQV